MASVDSGVETGNDSNDSSIVQHDGQQQQQQQYVAADQITNNNMVTAVASTSSSERANECNPYRRMEWPNDPSLNSNLFDLDGLMRAMMFDNAMFTFAKMDELRKITYQMNQMNQRETNKQILKACKQMLKATSDYHAKIMQSRSYYYTRKSVTKCPAWDVPRKEHRMRLAASTNNTEMMKKLLENGISPNNYDNYGRTPLHHAAGRGYAEIVRLLLEYGADPDVRDCIGNTPLHLATVASKITVVTQLLTAGTDVLALDQYGYNPVQLAKTKLRMLGRNNEDMLEIKEEMHHIVNMLLVYLRKQRNMCDKVEALSDFCSRLSLSNTSDQIQDDVKDLLAKVNSLTLTN